MSEGVLRGTIVEHARRMNELGINQGKSGNVSARWNEGFLVTPSAMPYESMQPPDIVWVQMDGAHEGIRVPSTEWRLHRDVYRARPEVHAIVHAHAMFATTLACLGRGIPAFHYMIALAGGPDIRCAPYATFGTQELSELALVALEGRTACLHAQHGMTVLSGSLPGALALAVEVETLAAMYWRALQIAEPPVLSATEMENVVRKFADYGKVTEPG